MAMNMHPKERYTMLNWSTTHSTRSFQNNDEAWGYTLQECTASGRHCSRWFHQICMLYLFGPHLTCCPAQNRVPSVKLSIFIKHLKYENLWVGHVRLQVRLYTTTQVVVVVVWAHFQPQLQKKIHNCFLFTHNSWTSKSGFDFKDRLSYWWNPWSWDKQFRDSSGKFVQD